MVYGSLSWNIWFYKTVSFSAAGSREAALVIENNAIVMNATSVFVTPPSRTDG